MLLNFSLAAHRAWNSTGNSSEWLDATDSRYVIYDSADNIRSQFNINLSKTFDNPRKSSLKTFYSFTFSLDGFERCIRWKNARRNRKLQYIAGMTKYSRILNTRNSFQNMLMWSLNSNDYYSLTINNRIFDVNFLRHRKL